MNKASQQLEAQHRKAPDEEISQEAHHYLFNLIWLSRIDKHQCHRCGRSFQNMIGAWPTIDAAGTKLLCLTCADSLVPGLRAALLSLDFMPGEDSGEARERWDKCREAEADLKPETKPRGVIYVSAKGEQNPGTSQRTKDDSDDSYNPRM